MNVSCAEVHVRRICCAFFRQLQLMQKIWSGTCRLTDLHPNSLQELTPPPPPSPKGFETGLLAPSDPSPPPLQPPLISVRQLYMLGLTISPETRVRVVTPPPMTSAANKHGTVLKFITKWSRARDLSFLRRRTKKTTQTSPPSQDFLLKVLVYR